MTKLLNIDANAKTIKGISRGFSTAVLYLAPYVVSGVNVCPLAAKAGCWRTCLNTAGRGGMPVGGTFVSPGGITLPNNVIQQARIRRTLLWTTSRQSFLIQLKHELELFVGLARRKGLTPVIRLNGTSDIMWERVQVQDGKSMMELFPDVQFYDYTKIHKRLYDTTRPKNYYLCLSGSAADEQYLGWCEQAERDGHSTVWVARDKAKKEILLTHARQQGLPAVDGDEHDLRFLDPPGARVILKAKGSARKETNGFVL